jgi:hypothetical protein
MSGKEGSEAALEDMYRQSLEDNLAIVSRFPVTLTNALQLSEAMLPSEDATTNIKIKTAVSECLNALTAISKLSSDLDILAES